ncbi:MAG: rhodanese-like domain-containing protein [Campylobacterota bacterium]
MYKKFFYLVVVSVFSLFVLSGCSYTQDKLSNASSKVKSLIQKHNLEVVDYEYVNNVINSGTRKTADAIIVDARPAKMYKAGAVPSSINITGAKFDSEYKQLENVDKQKEIIVYCGGWKCGKSPKVASMLKKKGFINVKLYQAGEPQWSKLDYVEVDIAVVKAAQSKNSALLIDARPYMKYLGETIPGAISIPESKVEELKGRLPINKNEKIIVFCEGYSCSKSHKLASKLIELNYSDVSVYAAGMPKWKEEGLATTKSGKTAIKETNSKPKFSPNGAKLGLDNGSIDGEWLHSLIKKDEVPSYIQIVDVTSSEQFNKGHIKGAINIVAENLSAKELYAKLPKDKTIVFNCTAGGRSIEAWVKLKDAGYDVSDIFYFDANVDCKGTDCKIEVNEALGL